MVSVRWYSVPSSRTCFSFRLRRPTRSTLFPYTTLFRSGARRHLDGGVEQVVRADAKHLDATNLVRHRDRKSTRLNSSHEWISYAVFCLKKKNCMHMISSVTLPIISRSHALVRALSDQQS